MNKLSGIHIHKSNCVAKSISTEEFNKYYRIINCPYCKSEFASHIKKSKQNKMIQKLSNVFLVIKILKYKISIKNFYHKYIKIENLQELTDEELDTLYWQYKHLVNSYFGCTVCPNLPKEIHDKFIMYRDKKVRRRNKNE